MNEKPWTWTHPNAKARRDYGVPDPAPVGILIQLDGNVIRMNEDGSADLILPSGHPRPGIAHATSRRRR